MAVLNGRPDFFKNSLRTIQFVFVELHFMHFNNRRLCFCDHRELKFNMFAIKHAASEICIQQ